MEKHAFGNFVPKEAKYLILGSFTAKQAVRGESYNESYDWFYSNNRNQFWPIIERVYGVKLDNKKSKQKLFKKLKMAMADIILRCERKNNSNLDINLKSIEYNLEIKRIIEENQIRKVFFTSRFVEKRFGRVFKDVNVEQVTLPSPSPRYTLKKQEKIKRYKEILPKLN